MNKILKYNNLKLIFALVGIICWFSSCKRQKNDEESNIVTGKVFYNNETKKLWRHRANTLSDQQKYSDKFNGFEIDIRLNMAKNELVVEHDVDSLVSITLKQFLNTMPDISNHYFWFDMKDLSNENAFVIGNKLKETLLKFNLLDQVICESPYTDALKKLHDMGLYTSYWIPHFKFEGTLDSLQRKYLLTIKQTLNDCPHNAISASYEMLPFIEKYLPNCNVHLWTNGIDGDNGKFLINELKSNKNVRVILVDYDSPF